MFELAMRSFVATLWLVCILPLDRAAAGDVTPLPRYSQAKSLREDSTLRSVAFVNESIGVCVGDRGTILQTFDGGQSWTLRESGVDCVLSDVAWVGPESLIAVGGGYDAITGISRGVVLVSPDQGVKWRLSKDRELARVHRVVWDAERELAMCWGDWSPLTLACFHVSRDKGMTWEVDATRADRSSELAEVNRVDIERWMTASGASAPLRGVCRASQDHLFAVGDHGLIVRSQDRGASWQTSRGAARQSAVLVVAARPQTISWSLIGSESIELGHRTNILMPRSSLPSNDATQPRMIDWVRHASMGLGAASVDVAPDEELADWIKLHRPSVLVLDRSLSPEQRDQLNQAALQVGVQRILTYSLEAGAECDSRLHASAMLTQSGVMAGDLWYDANQIVAPEAKTPESVCLRRTYDAQPGSIRGESVTTGLTLPHGKELVSKREAASRRQLQVIQARLREPELLQKIIHSNPTHQGVASALRTLLSQNAEQDRMRFLWNSFRQGINTHNQSLSQAALNLIASDTDVVLETSTSVKPWGQARWSAIEQSREWSMLSESHINGNKYSQASTVKQAAVTETIPLSPFQTDLSQVVPASGTSPILVGSQTPEVATLIPATSLKDLNSPRLNRVDANQVVDLTWEFQPQVLFLREALRRGKEPDDLAAVDQTGGNIKRLAAAAPAAAWSRLLAVRSLTAVRATAPPRLDGRLDDVCWRGESYTNESGNQSQLAYDDRFLYIAVNVPSAQMTKVATRRESTDVRDHDLSAADRLGLWFDVDRDTMTSFQLQTTTKLLTHDAVDGNSAWQPTWYVSSTDDQTRTVFEIAIQLSDLVQTVPEPGDAWFCKAECLPAGMPTQLPLRFDPTHWFRFQFE